MRKKTPEENDQAAQLAAAIRAIRQARRMRASEVARAMGMPARTYEHFETGNGRISFERLVRFAEVTNCDPFAICASVWLGIPDFALRAADNKFMAIVMIALRDLNEDLGDDIALIESGVIIGGFARVCKELAEHVRKRDTYAEAWLEQGAARLTGKSVRRPRD